MLTNGLVVYKLLGMQYIISNYLFICNIPDLRANDLLPASPGASARKECFHALRHHYVLL